MDFNDLFSIIQDCQNGVPGAWERFFPYYERIGFITLKGFPRIEDGDNKRDILQECFARIFEDRLRSFRGTTGGQAHNYLRTIVRNQAITYINKIKNENQIIDDEGGGIPDGGSGTSVGGKKIPDSGMPGPLQNLNTERCIEKLEELINMLPRKHREVFIMYWKGDRYEKIAETMEMSSGTVGAWISRAKQKIRPELKEMGCLQ